MDKENVSIEIPVDLYKKIEQKIENTEKTVSGYILETLEKSLTPASNESETLSEEDEEKVKERLKALGYMD